MRAARASFSFRDPRRAVGRCGVGRASSSLKSRSGLWVLSANRWRFDKWMRIPCSSSHFEQKNTLVRDYSHCVFLTRPPRLPHPREPIKCNYFDIIYLSRRLQKRWIRGMGRSITRPDDVMMRAWIAGLVGFNKNCVGFRFFVVVCLFEHLDHVYGGHQQTRRRYPSFVWNWCFYSGANEINTKNLLPSNCFELSSITNISREISFNLIST